MIFYILLKLRGSFKGVFNLKSDIVREKVIKGKPIYIVENHHEVILPWVAYSSTNEIAPVLLTFDHHMDTRTAFYRHSCTINECDWKTVSNKLLSTVDIDNLSDITSSLEKLRNNEHIDFSLKTNILSHAVIFSLLGVGICKDYSNDKICYVDPICISTCVKEDHNEECLLNTYNNVIERDELLFKLKQINKFIPGFFTDNTINKKFILDIDLDCFHTKKAINPNDISILNYLINNAEIITIATEGSYVELEKKEDDINEFYLLDKLLSHIENALK